MRGLLDDQTVGIPCEKCSRETPKSIGWIKTHSKFTCACGTVINIDASQFRGQIAEAERALRDLEKTINSLNKRK